MRRARFFLPLLSLVCLGCDADAGPSEDPPPTEDAALPDGRYFEGAGYMLPGSHVNVVKRIGVTTMIEPGVTKGFDLDGRTSDYTDEESCRHGDFVDPDGREGIDNQLAAIWSDLYPLVGEAVEALLQGAINEGRVLVMMELVGVDDLVDDDDVTFNVYRGLLDPEIGTFGFIAPSQTFYYDYDSPISTASNMAIVGGELVAGPVQLQLPINILDLDIIANIYGGFVRMQIAGDGTFTGYIGGAFSLDEILSALLQTGAAAETRLVAPIFENNADMGYEDGVCTLISVGFEFEGTTAFVVRDAERDAAAE